MSRRNKKYRPIQIELRTVHRYEISDEIERLIRCFLRLLTSGNVDMNDWKSHVDAKAAEIVNSFADAIKD